MEHLSKNDQSMIFNCTKVKRAASRCVTTLLNVLLLLLLSFTSPSASHGVTVQHMARSVCGEGDNRGEDKNHEAVSTARGFLSLDRTSDGLLHGGKMRHRGNYFLEKHNRMLKTNTADKLRPGGAFNALEDSGHA